MGGRVVVSVGDVVRDDRAQVEAVEIEPALPLPQLEQVAELVIAQPVGRAVVIGLPVELQVFSEARQFTPLGADSVEEIPAGEFGYVDAQQRVLCRLDLQQADFSKVTETTRNVLLIIEGTTAHSAAQMAESFEMSIATISRYCGGRVAEVVQPT